MDAKILEEDQQQLVGVKFYYFNTRYIKILKMIIW